MDSNENHDLHGAQNPMIIKYRMQNFKAFRDTGYIDLAPITILCGANSVGKSSVLKSILLVKQSSVERRSSSMRDAPTQPLLLNGEWTKLGSWSDTINWRMKNQPIVLSWDVTASVNEVAQLKDEFFFAIDSGKNNTPFSIKYQTQIRSDVNAAEELSSYIEASELTTSECKITLQANNSDNLRSGCFSISANSLDRVVQGKELNSRRSRKQFSSEIASLVEKLDIEIQLGNVQATLVGPFIANLSPIFDASWMPFLRRLLATASQQRAGKRGPKPKWITNFEKKIKSYEEESKDEFSLLMFDSQTAEVTALISYITRCFFEYFDHFRSSVSPLWRRIRYLGPLRYEPQRFYQFNDTGGVDIGVSGEFTVQVLSLESNRHINYSPISYQDDGSIRIEESVSTSLLEATNYWLAIMDLPIIEISPLRQSLYELKLGPDGHALPDVGFGVSQVLPIIVESLRAESGDEVVLEQPEIHLHPRIQSIIADFFIARSQDGVRFLVESHSEYLVKRLCRRIAEDSIDSLSDKISIAFVSEDLIDGGASCQRLQLNEFGEIENWPPGFFDTSDDMYWASASLKRRAEASRRRKATLL